MVPILVRVTASKMAKSLVTLALLGMHGGAQALSMGPADHCLTGASGGR